jgi:hypothetical protein
MAMEKQIIVLAAGSQERLDSNGADVEEKHCETLTEAKRRARYLLTEEYRIASECSERLGYARVLVNGKCIADYGA